MSGKWANLPPEAAKTGRHWGRRSWLMACGAMAIVASTGCNRSPPSYHAIDLTGADFGRSIALQDPEGRTRSLDEFKGRYVMLFFGFTQCPDVCPTALARAVEVRQLLGSDAGKLQVLLVTVDPERDTPEVLRSYIAAFDPSFIALRGDLQATEAVAREFKIHYAKVPTSTSYTMDHTALTYILDTEGRLRLALRHEQSPQEVAQDLRTLMKTGR